LSTSIVNKEPFTGRTQKEDNSIVNIADVISSMLLAVRTSKCKIDITGTIAATIPFLTNASGSYFTFSGDVLYLGADATEFNGNQKLKIFLNGHLQDNGVDAIFVSAYSFYLNIAVENTDKIIIIKGV